MSIDYFNSPIGLLEIVANDNYLESVSFVKKKNKILRNKITKICKSQLSEYFSGKRKKFNIPMKLSGSNFSKSVLKELIKVSFGKTITYGELAKKSGRKNASRAVGTCMKNNPLCIVIPCHRVVGIINKYNYSAGKEKKKWLLKHES